MVDGLTRSTHQVVGQDALTTAAALGAETPADRTTAATASVSKVVK